jgi:hypothetical protein
VSPPAKPLTTRVNHLGATPERIHPNAGLKVHLPIAPRLTTM